MFGIVFEGPIPSTDRTCDPPRMDSFLGWTSRDKLYTYKSCDVGDTQPWPAIHPSRALWHECLTFTGFNLIIPPDAPAVPLCNYVTVLGASDDPRKRTRMSGTGVYLRSPGSTVSPKLRQAVL